MAGRYTRPGSLSVDYYPVTVLWPLQRRLNRFALLPAKQQFYKLERKIHCRAGTA